jgi:hypothetical protein
MEDVTKWERELTVPRRAFIESTSPAHQVGPASRPAPSPEPLPSIDDDEEEELAAYALEAELAEMTEEELRALVEGLDDVAELSDEGEDVNMS